MPFLVHTWMFSNASLLTESIILFEIIWLVNCYHEILRIVGYGKVFYLAVLESLTNYPGHTNIPNHDVVHSILSVPINTGEAHISFSLSLQLYIVLFKYFLKAVKLYYVNYSLLWNIMTILYIILPDLGGYISIIHFQGTKKNEKEFNDLL